MAMAMAVGASVDVARGVRGTSQVASVAGGLRPARGVRTAVVAFPRGLGSPELLLHHHRHHLRYSPRPHRLPVRASQNGGPEFDDKNKNEGEKKGSVDWDKAWESFPKPKQQPRKNPFTNLLSMFNLNMEQHVNRRPTHSRFPLSEETDPMRKTERRALDAWTDPKFTYAGVGVVVGLFVYMVVVIGPPPS